MLLGFNKRFKAPIKDGTKLHSMREDAKDRWKVGMAIQMATGVRTKNYECFDRDKICTGLQTAEIKYYVGNGKDVHVFVDGKELPWSTIEMLALNDGFRSVGAFFEWFNKDWKGKIIHWDEVRY